MRRKGELRTTSLGITLDHIVLKGEETLHWWGLKCCRFSGVIRTVSYNWVCYFFILNYIVLQCYTHCLMGRVCYFPFCYMVVSCASERSEVQSLLLRIDICRRKERKWIIWNILLLVILCDKGWVPTYSNIPVALLSFLSNTFRAYSFILSYSVQLQFTTFHRYNQFTQEAFSSMLYMGLGWNQACAWIGWMVVCMQPVCVCWWFNNKVYSCIVWSLVQVDLGWKCFSM